MNMHKLPNTRKSIPFPMEFALSTQKKIAVQFEAKGFDMPYALAEQITLRNIMDIPVNTPLVILVDSKGRTSAGLYIATCTFLDAITDSLQFLFAIDRLKGWLQYDRIINAYAVKYWKLNRHSSEQLTQTPVDGCNLHHFNTIFNLKNIEL